MAPDRLSFSTLCCAEMPAGTVPHPLPELVEAVGAAGFTRIGLDWFTIRDAERRGLPLDLGGLVPSELCAFAVGPDGAKDATVAGAMARRCAELGIPLCVLAVTAPLTAELDDRLAAIAGIFGDTRLGVEVIPYSSVRTLAEAKVLCGRTGLGVVLDTLHLLRSGATLADVAELDPAGIAGVQLADGPPSTPDSLAQESRSGRLLPGEGAVDTAGMLAVLDRIGYTGPLTIEVLSASLRTLPPAELATRARTACLPYAS